ncbi:4-hydroxy-3-methylbut-2-enyl diphosphate reductase [Pelagibacteraceae bacterium]|nr:4-hydroxy-3-methylbut-2-enyl diphosphate reductase [Pelagibacteraceae bacterium]
MSKELNIYLAGPRGFCAGVDRAIEMVKEALKKYGQPVYVRHEIVHNKYVVENLKSEGAVFIEELNEIKDKSRPVIFSAHGVPKSVPQEALDLNLLYFDATCPLVSKIHKEVEFFDRKQFPVILIGHRNHPEVIGTMGQTKSEIFLVETVEDVIKLPLNKDEKIAYVTQTTLSVDDTKDIVTEVKKRFNNVIEPKKNDICYATTNRQEAVKKIASNCDYFLVIGASNSSNSLRLVEVAKNYGSKKAILVEDVDSLNLNIFEDSKNIGITASASSPEILVKKLIDKLKNNFSIKINEAHYQKENVYFKVPQKLKN